MEKVERVRKGLFSFGTGAASCATLFITLWIVVFNVIVPFLIGMWWYRSTNTPAENEKEGVPKEAASIQDADFENW